MACRSVAPVPGETDLATILASLRVDRRPETYTIVTRSESVSVADGIAAVVRESEGTSVVLTVGEARRRGWPVEFEATWLTIDVHTALEGVGLTAAISVALAEHDIPCNVVAGYHHDHLLVPHDRADEAVTVLVSLGGEADRDP